MISEEIQLALAAKQSENPLAPANLFEMPLSDLARLDYVKVDSDSIIRDNDILAEQDSESLIIIKNTKKNRRPVGNLDIYRQRALVEQEKEARLLIVEKIDVPLSFYPEDFFEVKVLLEENEVIIYG